MELNWCESECPELATFNKAYIHRNGKGLFQNIELIGDKETIEEIVKNEAILFCEKGLIDNDTIVTDKCFSDNFENSRSVFLLHSDSNFKRVAGNIYFFYGDSCKHFKKNTFKLTISKRAELLNKFLDKLDMPHDNIENLINKGFDKIIGAALENYEIDEIINKVLLYHYSRDIDDVVSDRFDNKDFYYIRDYLAKRAYLAITYEPNDSKGESCKEPENTISESIEKEEKCNKDIMIQDPQESQDDIKNNENQEREDSQKDSSESIPEPQYKIQKLSFKKKETLSAEDEKNNEELLSSLIKLYQDMVSMLDETKNSQWKVIRNKMEECIKTLKFNTQWSRLYLELSNDVTTDIYAALYELDEKTKEFHEGLIHQSITLGCPLCGKDWEEDITFLKKGIHYVECPNCYCERGFEKK